MTASYVQVGLKAGDRVSVVDGKYVGRNGTIKTVYWLGDNGGFRTVYRLNINSGIRRSFRAKQIVLRMEN